MNNEEVLKLQVEAVNRLFVSERNKYILQNGDGTYTNSNVFYYNKKLYDNVIENHLTNKSTIGVFSNKLYTPFLLFDVDMFGKKESEVRKTVTLIINEIEKFGVSRDYCTVSYSGSKGYHIYLHFDNHVYVSYAKRFHAYILQKCGLDDKTVEFRGCPNFAVKLPLSINKKSGKFCYYVDNNNFKPIIDKLYITRIKQFPSWLFCDYVEDIKDSDKFEKYTNDKLKEFEHRIESVEIQTVKDIEKNGLKCEGTRHYYTFRIAMLYNTFGYDKHKAHQCLIDWFDRQDESMYKTKRDTCLKEISKSIDWVYKKNAKFGVKFNNEIKLSKEELVLVSTMKNKSTMYMLFAILIYNKQFEELNNGEFYLTYGHIMKLLNMSDRHTISSNFKYLIECGILEKIVQGNGFISNRYRLTDVCKFKPTNGITVRFDSIPELGLGKVFSNSFRLGFADSELSSMFSKSLRASMLY